MGAEPSATEEAALPAEEAALPAASVAEEMALPAESVAEAMAEPAESVAEEMALPAESVAEASSEEMLALAEIEGEEHVRRAYEQGRGVIFIGAHLGYWEQQGIEHAVAWKPFSIMVPRLAKVPVAGSIRPTLTGVFCASAGPAAAMAAARARRVRVVFMSSPFIV